MQQQEDYTWKMINITPGYVIYEDCAKIREVRSYFSKEPVEVVEEYFDGKHHWKSTGSAQSIQFDMQNNKTNEIVTFKELMGLMLCTEAKEESPIYPLIQLGPQQNIWIYIALSYDSPEGRDALSLEKIGILNDYFNERINTPDKKVLIVPHQLAGAPTKYDGIMIQDVGLTEMEQN